MGSYIINFTVYTLAMSGLIFFAFYVYKKVMNGSILPAKNHDMYVEETLTINPRKSLMIVNTGGERFLIASDVDKTTLISKLEKEANVTKNKSVLNNTENALPIDKNKTGEINFEEVNQYIEKLQQNSNGDENFENTAVEVENAKGTEAVEEVEEGTITTTKEEPDAELDKLYGPVRLEVISNKNPNPIRRKHSYMSKSYSQGKTVTIEVDSKKERSGSPIKGIVQKVSNL